MVTSSVMLLALSVGLPGTLTGIAVIVAVFRAEKDSLADIIRAAVRTPSTSPAEQPLGEDGEVGSVRISASTRSRRKS